ncbi:MAG: hypothetical protein CMP23_01705 [Rickettsiales bacterium]|nr:hypothetical protein [Rickettsiales bacterium]
MTEAEGSFSPWLRRFVGLCGLCCAFLIGACEEPVPDDLARADALFRAGRLEAAAAAYTGLGEEAKGWRPFAAYRAAVIYRDALGDSRRAEKAFEECNRRYPMDSWGYSCLVELGDLRRDARRFRAAISSYRAALEQRPRGSLAEHSLFHSGRCYLALGEFEQARVEWQELGREFPASALLPEVSLERARSFDLQGRYRDALEAYQATLEDHPGGLEEVLAAYGVAESYEQMGMLKEAELAFRSVLERHPNRQAVELKLSSLESRMERRDREPTQVIQHGRVLNPSR